MYLLIEKTHNGMDFVQLGPMEWRPRFFQACLRDDFDIIYNVPDSNPTGEAIIINQIARIIPVTDIGIVGTYNPKTQLLVGPSYNFFETYAEMYHTVTDKPLDMVQNELKTQVAANRYRYEVMGVNVTIQGMDVIALTTREDRGLYLQAYQLGKNNVNWKFGDKFITLSTADIGTIVTAVSNHIQAAFDWEAAKQQAIDNCTTLAEIDAIAVMSDNTAWEPVVVQPNSLGIL